MLLLLYNIFIYDNDCFLGERSKTPEKIKKNEEAASREAIKKSESPAKMLEDLFKKTKAIPYIYYLPLSEEVGF